MKDHQGEEATMTTMKGRTGAARAWRFLKRKSGLYRSMVRAQG